MSAKLLLSETSRENRLRMRESSALSTRPSIATKTKIVVHINNYILPKENSNKNLRSLASPASSIDYYETEFPRTEYRFNDFNSQKSKTKHDKEKEHEYMILKAKSLNFPVKVRSSYAIYQISEENKKFTKEYNSLENKLSNIVNYEYYKRLPFLKAASADQQPHQTMRQMFMKEKVANPNSLPHYLKPNNNLLPTYSIINKSKSDPKLTPVLSYKKEIKERQNNLIERFKKIDHLLKKRQKKKNQESKSKPKETKETEAKPGEQVENKPKTSATNILKKTAVVEPAQPPKKASVNVNKNETAKKSNSDSFRLPFILKTFDPNEFSLSLTNHSTDSSQSVDNYAEYAQLNTLTDDMDEKINKIIKRYPSIVLRRQSNRSFPKLNKYLNDNHIKYEISHFKNTTDSNNDTDNNKEAASITTNDKS